MDETLRTLAAGTCGGMASILIVHPLDTIRTRLQAAPAQRYRGAWHCASSTVQAEGARALYKGLAWPLAAQGVYKAIMFGVYGFMSRSLRGDDPTRPLAAYEVFAAGGLAGGANALILAPVELIRNRFQVASHAVTLREVLPQGVRGMYRGLGATLLRDVPGVGAYYAAFELMRRRAVALRGAPKLSLGELAVAGAFGGVAFWTVALPLARRGVPLLLCHRAVAMEYTHLVNTQDFAKTHLQVGAEGASSVAGVLASAVRAGGLRRIYVGYASALARGVPGAAVVFSVYGAVYERLGGS